MMTTRLENPEQAGSFATASDRPAQTQSNGNRGAASALNGQLSLFSDLQARARSGFDLNLQPLDATFRDSGEAPLHSWFPYLEGYSPKFVDRVRHEFLTDAKRVLEPFAGTGTTPIVLAQSGVECGYAEVNPVMVFITQTKLDVLRLPKSQRNALSNELKKLASHLPDVIAKSIPDKKLRHSYGMSFGKSIFFDEPAFESILRIRSLNDQISAKDQLLGNCFAVAVLSSLIPSSRLKRAGDLRFRTPKELSFGIPHPLDVIRNRLIAQADDLAHVAELKSAVTFVTPTAGTLHEHLTCEWDGAITSPPYLNGTNYIRNARLELWYLRCISEQSHMRILRNQVITSGINDVHAHTRWDPVTSGVGRVIRAIEQNNYDFRIAKMVGGYFQDMATVFLSLTKCVRPGGRLCVDIGDSIYNGVHVPTDDLLVEIAEEIGYFTVERVHLRKRKSKNGQDVRQQLLVFERRISNKTITIGQAKVHSQKKMSPRLTSRNKLDWHKSWKSFKETLPHQLPPYAKREWGGPLHSMCSYQGKIKPALAHHLLACFSSPGDVVLDPFSGAGTIPLEACRMGRRGFGIDISRLGYVLTLAKVAKSSPQGIEKSLCALETAIEKYRLKASDIERARAVRFNSEIPDYFHSDTLREILAAREYFLSNWDSGGEWAVLFASTLHLLHGNRPYALSRRSHPVTPFKPTGRFEYRPLMPRLRDKVARLLQELVVGREHLGGAALADSTVKWPKSIPKGDVILTSPPFFDSTRFYMANWMRYWFAGWERGDFDVQAANFLETKQKKNLDIYQQFFEVSRQRLRDDGLLVLHLGHSAKCDMGAELSKRVTPWFKIADSYTEAVDHCESHGIRDKGTVHGHTYLVLIAD